MHTPVCTHAHAHKYMHGWQQTVGQTLPDACESGAWKKVMSLVLEEEGLCPLCIFTESKKINFYTVDNAVLCLGLMRQGNSSLGHTQYFICVLVFPKLSAFSSELIAISISSNLPNAGLRLRVRSISSTQRTGSVELATQQLFLLLAHGQPSPTGDRMAGGQEGLGVRVLWAEGQCGLGAVGLTCRGNSHPWLYALGLLFNGACWELTVRAPCCSQNTLLEPW